MVTFCKIRLLDSGLNTLVSPSGSVQPTTSGTLNSTQPELLVNTQSSISPEQLQPSDSQCSTQPQQADTVSLTVTSPGRIPPSIQSVNDIGTIIDSTKSVNEICASLGSLSPARKYALLFKHVVPPSELPKTFSHGCLRKFRTSWIDKYPWLRYSSALDAVFCGPCSLLLEKVRRKDKGQLVNVPFSNWVKLSDTLSTHSKHAYHREALQLADIMKASIEKPMSRVDVLLSTTL